MSLVNILCVISITVFVNILLFIRIWCRNLLILVIFPSSLEDYKTHIWYKSKDEAINERKDADLNDMSGMLQDFKKIIISFFIIIKTSHKNQLS